MSNYIYNCFQCGSQFRMTDAHEKNFLSSGLCERCFNNALEESGRDAVLCGAIDKLLNIYKELESVINVLKSNKKEWRL